VSVMNRPVVGYLLAFLAIRRGGFFTKSTKTGKTRALKLAQSAVDVLRTVRAR